MKLGELLVENDLPPYDGSETWVELLLRDPAHRRPVAREVRAVAEEIAADPRYGDEERSGPMTTLARVSASSPASSTD